MNSPLALIFSGLTDAILTATVMMTIVGIVAAVVLSRLSIQSWRLQSFLVVAVLLQGVMLIRTPIHLGLIEQPQPRATDVEAALNEFDEQFSAAAVDLPEQTAPAAVSN